MIAVGTERITVDRWLPDDPDPRARVHDWPDSDGSGDDAADIDPTLLDDVERVARRIAALAVELGARGQLPEFRLSDDPVLRLYQLAIISPLGALDRRRLLSTPGLAERTVLLAELLGEQELMLQARLTFGD
ncbi:hypothetical protein BH10ACT3_BH10ACT3_08790 [soil metagenome]